MVPSALPWYEPPSAWHASSRTYRLCFFASAITPSISQGKPWICTGTIALVCAEIFRSASATSMVMAASHSQITGIAPASSTASAVAMYVYPGTMTSSPGPMPIAVSAAVSAPYPDVMSSVYAAPVYAFHSSSKWYTSRPAPFTLKKSWLSIALATASISSLPILYMIASCDL